MPPVWSFAHNWAVPVKESLESKTRVITSEDGTEQRAELRDNPRRTLDYSCVLADADSRRRCEALIHRYQSELWDVPIWTDAIRFSAAADTGSTSFTGDFSRRDFDTDGRAMIWRNSRLFEIVDLAFVTDSEVLTSPTTQPWRPGDLLVPVRKAWMQEQLTSAKKRRDFLIASPSFEILGTERSVRRFGNFEPTLYRDLPVLIRPSSAATELGLTFRDRRITFDPGVGLKSVFSPEFAGRRESVFSWIAKGRQQIGDLLDWVRYCSGMLSPFYLFSWQRDFDPVLPIEAADDFFDFQAFGYGDSYADSRNRLDVGFRLKDGTMLSRRLTFDSASGDNERCLLDAPLGIDVTAENLHLVGFLYPVRLATDRVELEWATSSLVRWATTAMDYFPKPNFDVPAPTWFDGSTFLPEIDIQFDSNALSGLPSGVTYLGTRIYRDGVLLDTVIDGLSAVDYTDEGLSFGVTYEYTLENVFDAGGAIATASNVYNWYVQPGS